MCSRFKVDNDYDKPSGVEYSEFGSFMEGYVAGEEVMF